MAGKFHRSKEVFRDGRVYGVGSVVLWVPGGSCITVWLYVTTGLVDFSDKVADDDLSTKCSGHYLPCGSRISTSKTLNISRPGTAVQCISIICYFYNYLGFVASGLGRLATYIRWLECSQQLSNKGKHHLCFFKPNVPVEKRFLANITSAT